MAFDTMSDDTYICPTCKQTARIRVRIDDWNRMEIDISDKEAVKVYGGCLPHPTCVKCGIDMEILERHDTEPYYQTTIIVCCNTFYIIKYNISIW